MKIGSTCEEQLRHPFLERTLLAAPRPLAYCGSFRQKNRPSLPISGPSSLETTKSFLLSMLEATERRKLSKLSSCSLWWGLSFSHHVKALSDWLLSSLFSSYTPTNTKSMTGPLVCSHKPVLLSWYPRSQLCFSPWVGRGAGAMRLEVHLLSAAWSAPSPLMALEDKACSISSSSHILW